MPTAGLLPMPTSVATAKLPPVVKAGTSTSIPQLRRPTAATSADNTPRPAQLVIVPNAKVSERASTGRVQQPVPALAEPPSFSSRKPALARMSTRRIAAPLVLHSSNLHPKPGTPTHPFQAAAGPYPTPPPSATLTCTPGPPAASPTSPAAWSDSSSSLSSTDDVWESFSTHSLSSSLEHMCAGTSTHRAPHSESDEDPFYLDFEKACPLLLDHSLPGSSNLQHRASLVLVPPSDAPLSLVRERTADGTVYVKEINGADGRRWSLRVPESGLPGDMVRMLEELENLANDLRQTLPTIVVTQSTKSMENHPPVDIACVGETSRSPGLLHPPLSDADMQEEEAEVEEDGSRLPSTVKEKRKAHGTDDVLSDYRLDSGTVATAVSPAIALSEPSIECIYIPELASEFLSGSSMTPVTEPAPGYRSKPASVGPRKAFFSGLKQPAARASPFTSQLRTGKPPRLHVKPKPKPPLTSALPVFKHTGYLPRDSAASSGSSTKARAPADPSSYAHCSRTVGQAKAPIAMTAALASASVAAPPTGLPRPRGLLTRSPVAPLSASPRARPAGSPLSASPRARPAGSPLRSLFRRPATRSASKPPLYTPPTAPMMPRPLSYARGPTALTTEAAKLDPRRMPRLPSARDLLRKLR
ncbi:hypothetical protein FA95DRAFT_1682007 [Auriscalpium vulgare]|uniref:Uncharacterized protein n=1 Tax=Auriscalpium vulgare TaxID=40419 RepID=A0ACB8RGK2_9AGAM|nr:hypothetical protein FA95DRAFT_1682007 [Auriscalpium vulgare]